MKLIILDRPESDLRTGYHIYEQQTFGAGSYFLESLYSDIESLRLFAGIHKRHLGYYRLLSKRFPYAIYYRLDDKTIPVWRVMDCRRNPQWIQRQLKAE